MSGYVRCFIGWDSVREDGGGWRLVRYDVIVLMCGVDDECGGEGELWGLWVWRGKRCQRRFGEAYVSQTGAVYITPSHTHTHTHTKQVFP